MRIHPVEYRKAKAQFMNLAAHRSAENLIVAFRQIPYEPYAPVRRQLLNILRAVNRERLRAGFEPVPMQALRLRRRPYRVFDDTPLMAVTAEQMPMDHSPEV